MTDADLKDRLRALVIMDEVGSDNRLGKEAADRIASLEAENARLQPYVDAFRREEERADRAEQKIDDLEAQLAEARKALEPFAKIAAHIDTKSRDSCSTQSGCPVGCRFCGAGDFFVRSLTADEIASQPKYLLDRVLEDYHVYPEFMGRLQIMFMSMGEPLLNLKGLIPALRTLYARYPKAALLISTSAPKLPPHAWDELLAVCEEIPTIGLQFSVHESTDEARDALIPFKNKMTLAEIAVAGEQWHYVTGRNPFFNYCAHDANETDDDANRIRALLDPDVFCATVSVVCERSEGLPATNQHQRDLAASFASRLVQRGYDVRVFDPAGQDTIGGGCGQLWFVQQWMRDNPGKARPSIGMGKPEVHAPSR